MSRSQTFRHFTVRLHRTGLSGWGTGPDGKTRENKGTLILVSSDVRIDRQTGDSAEISVMVFLRGLLFLFLHEYPVMEHGPVYMNGDVGWWIRKHDTRLRREEQTIMKKAIHPELVRQMPMQQILVRRPAIRQIRTVRRETLRTRMHRIRRLRSIRARC